MPRRRTRLESRGLGCRCAAHPQGGVLVDFVFRSSPAAKVGLKAGDMLVSMDGVMLDEPADVVAHIKRRQPGMTVNVVRRRGGVERRVAVELARHPGSRKIAKLMYVGSKAANLSLTTRVQGDVPSTAKEMDGKVLVIDFFASWCASCRALTPKLADWHKRFSKRGVKVVGVTTDDPQLAAETAKRWKIPYALASDTSQRTNNAYRVSAIPAVFLVDRKGVIRDVMIGYDPSRFALFEKHIDKLIKQR